MKAWIVVALTALCAAGPTAACAQPSPDADALRSSLTEMLSLLSFGSVAVPAQAAQISPSGNEFTVRLPLNGFVAPPDAAAEARARPAANGAWDITSMTVPAAGALGSSIDQVVSYTIARQAMRGHLDSKLATPSTFAADLGAITLQTAAGSQTSEQSIERMTLDGTIASAAGGRVDLFARDAAFHWHVIAHDPGGTKADSSLRRVEGKVSMTGLDRRQGSRFMAAARSLKATAKPSGPTDLPPAMREPLRHMLDALDGLLTRFEADETLDGLTLNFGNNNAGSLGRMQVHLDGRSENERLNAGMDLAMDELSMTNLAADSAAFVPHHVTVRSVLAGIPIGQLKAFLRAALAQGADPAALQRQATGMLGAPGAHAGIETLAFDAGPLRVHASARFVPRINGEIGADIHISATGVDALLSQVQTRPSLQGFMPMVFLAKGMGRVQGDSIVWDIGLGGGPLTINGAPFGQPAGRTR